ncbi:MAG: proline--tRNA ligase [Actinomycetota bacterium]|nr:proline--tRNA ligase [Actinomycetota bacterium]
MIARASQLFLPTLREDPADAEAASHKLLVRGGFIRQVGAGIWTFLPLGWRVHQKVIQIVREEMDAIGGQEMLMPLLTPAELWQQSGRYEIPEVFKLEDRAGRPFVLPMTHEETVTLHARELRSYRQLPQILYHFSVKERDEPRARGGLIRAREFIMKDAYSFDRDDAGLDESFRKHSEAYNRIFARSGIESFEVSAESGIMGGSGSQDFLAPAGSGENTLVMCENGDYTADLEIAGGVPPVGEFPDELPEPQEVATPGQRTIESVSQFLGLDERATAKAMPVVANGRLVLALVRGDDRLNEMKLLALLGETFRPAQPEEIRESFGADGGSIGPVGVSVEIVADETLREGQYVVGANRDDVHLRGVQAGRDFEARFADLREARKGDACPRCGGQLRLQVAIEVGHIFKLETRFSEALTATFVDEDGSERPLVMGSYGIGTGRIMAAAVEQHHDERGIAWPRSIAPYDVHVVALPGVEEQAEQAAQALEGAGADVLLDDRDARAGEKFADADLIGIPLRVTVGKKTAEDGAVDVRERESGEERRVRLAELGGIL